ncbi:MAG: hypothetical protein ACK5JH_02880 [Anaerocolumna sp.]
MNIFHIHNWDHTIKHWDEEYLREENPPMREFYFDLKDMLIFIKDYVEYLSFKEGILVSLYGGRFIGVPYDDYYKQCVEEVTKWLHERNMRINSSGGLKLSKEELIDCIDIISESEFMGMSGLCIMIPESGVIIEVQHHMNYLIYTNDVEKQKNIIKELIESHSNVTMF